MLLVHKACGQVVVEVDCFEQLFFGDLFVGGMGYVDGAGAQQEGLAPGGERGDVRSELGDHGGQVADLAHADEGEVQAEVDVGAAGYGGEDGALDLVRGAYQADEEVRLGLVGDDVGGAASTDEAYVEGGLAVLFEIRLERQRHGEKVVERGDELVDGGFAEFRVGGVGH